MTGQNLLHHQVEPVRSFVSRKRCRYSLGFKQPVDWSMRKPVERAFIEQTENQAMRVIEHVRQFHAQPGQLVDVEKTPVVDVVRRPRENAPRAILILDQPSTSPSFASIARVPFSWHGGGDRLAHLVVFGRGGANCVFSSARAAYICGRHSARLAKASPMPLQLRMRVPRMRA